MHMSRKGKKLLSLWEGVRLEVYKDSAGLDTIGVGHLITREELESGCININGQDIAYRDGLTYDQVMDLLDQDVKRFEDAVNSHVSVPLNQHQYDALVSFCFNVGTGNFKNSTLLTLLNNEEYDEVPVQLRRWNKSGGRVIKGLINRREKEIELWNS